MGRKNRVSRVDGETFVRHIISYELTCLELSDIELNEFRERVASTFDKFLSERLEQLCCAICPECASAASNSDEGWLPAVRDEFRGRTNRVWLHSRKEYVGQGVCCSSHIREFLAREAEERDKV